MRNERKRSRWNFQLESLEGRLAPTGGLSHAMVNLHANAQVVHRDAPRVEIQHKHRGQVMAQNRGRHDLVDNDLAQNGVPDNDQDDVMEHPPGVRPHDGPNHDLGDDHGGHRGGRN